MAWTDFDDVKRRFHRPIPERQQNFVTSLIDDAEDLLTDLVEDLPRRIESGEVDKARVKRMVARAVIPVLRNPEGYISDSSSRGPFANSGTRAPNTVVTEIRFEERDLARLRPTPAPPARTIRLNLPAWRRP